MKYTDITRQAKVNGELVTRSFSDAAYKAYSESSYEVAEVTNVLDGSKHYVISMGKEIAAEFDTFFELEEFFEDIYYNRF